MPGKILLSLAMLLAVVPGASAQIPCGAGGVALQVLGSGGPELAGKRAGSSELVWLDGRALLLIDAGGGSALRFGESGAQFADLDAILLSRLHADRTSDLPALVQASRFTGRTRVLPIYGPGGGRLMPSTVTFVRDLFDGTRGAWRHLGDLLAPLAPASYKLDPHDVREPPARLGAARRGSAPIKVFANERVRVFAVPAAYGTAPALAWRVETGDKAVVILGDAQASDETLLPLLANADLLLAVHTPPETRDAGPPPAALAQLAQAARVRELVLTQRATATLAREDESLAAIRKAFGGPVRLADDLACLKP